MKKTTYMGLVLGMTLMASLAFAESQPLVIPIQRTVRITTPSGHWAQGVLINGDRVLTAAHVVESAKADAIFFVDSLRFRGAKATVLRRGNMAQVDLALLGLQNGQSIPTISVPEIEICRNASKVGDQLEVAFDNQSSITHASADFLSIYHGQVASTATEAFFSHGVSGAGVYAENGLCLVGIISHQELTSGSNGCLKNDLDMKPTTTGCSARIGTVFVGTDDIRKFLQ